MATILTIINRTSRFGSNAEGLEKILRLFQALAQIMVACIASPPDARPWVQARKQFALGRRYLRFFRFVDAFASAYAHFNSSTGVASVLQVGKWSCLAMYLLLESCTVMDAMEVWNTTWAPLLLLEANKFWFFSLIFSQLLSFLQLLPLYFSVSQIKTEKVSYGSKSLKDSVANERAEVHEQTVKRQVLLKKMVIDGCDILIPGHITGWLKTTPAIVGMTTIISTTLGSGNIWNRM